MKPPGTHGVGGAFRRPEIFEDRSGQTGFTVRLFVAGGNERPASIAMQGRLLRGHALLHLRLARMRSRETLRVRRTTGTLLFQTEIDLFVHDRRNAEAAAAAARLQIGLYKEEHAMSTNSLAFLITDNDRRRLGTMLDEAYTTAAVPREHLHRLECNLEQAVGIAETEVLPDVVTMNSEVEIVDLDSGEREVYTLVYPEDADIRLDRISVLAPIGQAILGRRAGDVVAVPVPSGAGERWFEIAAVHFQPERAGQYQL